jgi:SAM-dependent methyltransferase
VQAPEPDPVSVTAQSYEEGAASWHDAHRDEDRAISRRDGYGRFADFLGRRGLVLDLGCGSGLDIPALQALGLAVVALDISRAMLRIASSVAPGVAGRLLCGDIRALPLANSSVDGVWADGSLHHLPKQNLLQVFREIACVLRPDGLFGMSVERGHFEGFVEQKEGVAGQRWYSYYEAAELQAVSEAANLHTVDLFVGGPSEHSAGFVSLLMRK